MLTLNNVTDRQNPDYKCRLYYRTLNSSRDVIDYYMYILFDTNHPPKLVKLNLGNDPAYLTLNQAILTLFKANLIKLNICAIDLKRSQVIFDIYLNDEKLKMSEDPNNQLDTDEPASSLHVNKLAAEIHTLVKHFYPTQLNAAKVCFDVVY